MHSDGDYLHAVKISHSLSTAPEKENFELKHVLHFWTSQRTLILVPVHTV